MNTYCCNIDPLSLVVAITAHNYIKDYRLDIHQAIEITAFQFNVSIDRIEKAFAAVYDLELCKRMQERLNDEEKANREKEIQALLQKLFCPARVRNSKSARAGGKSVKSKLISHL